MVCNPLVAVSCAAARGSNGGYEVPIPSPGCWCRNF